MVYRVHDLDVFGTFPKKKDDQLVRELPADIVYINQNLEDTQIIGINFYSNTVHISKWMYKCSVRPNVSFYILDPKFIFSIGFSSKGGRRNSKKIQ